MPLFELTQPYIAHDEGVDVNLTMEGATGVLYEVAEYSVDTDTKNVTVKLAVYNILPYENVPPIKTGGKHLYVIERGDTDASEAMGLTSVTSELWGAE